MSLEKENLIDSYLRGDLTGADLSSFENQLLKDPTFKEEVLQEQFVKDGISQFRKGQLKSRLDAIDVSPAWYTIGTSSSTLMKLAAASVAALLVGSISYNLYPGAPKILSGERSSEYVAISSPNDWPVFKDEPVIPGIVVPAIEEEISVEDGPSRSILEAKDILVDNYQSSITKDDAADKRSNFTADVHLPDLNDVDPEEAMRTKAVGIPEVSKADRIEGDNIPLNVKTVNRRSETIKYKYFEGKLFLYGDFKNEPYEILEINGATQRKIYVYYDSEYYEVKATDRITELPVINGDKLIRELEIIRNNKLK